MRALLSSLSSTVRRQSSIASLNAVTVRITIIGTAPRPGFDALKMGNIYPTRQYAQTKKVCGVGEETCNITMKKK